MSILMRSVLMRCCQLCSTELPAAHAVYPPARDAAQASLTQLLLVVIHLLVRQHMKDRHEQLPRSRHKRYFVRLVPLPAQPPVELLRYESFTL